MGKKILIVDDEVEAIEFASTALAEGGFTPTGARTAEEGMRKAREEKPSLILLDILMPERGGIRMYDDLKHDDKTRDIPVMILTAFSKVDSGPLAMHLKDIMMREDQDIPAAAGYIEKPANADRILKLVRELLS